jgi:hypothetical protein
MAGVNWWQISRADAEAFRDHVVRRSAARLIDLARQMKATGGPIELMDATPASLVPLWEWYLRMVEEDFPGTRDDAVPSVARFLGFEDLPKDLLRAGYVAESFEHYLFLITDNVTGDARWEVSSAKSTATIIDDETNRAGIVSSANGFLSAQETLFRLALRAIRARPVARDPKVLENFFRNRVSLSDPSLQPRYRLLELANEPEVPWDDPVRQPPIRRDAVRVATRSDGPSGFALVIGAIASDPGGDLPSMKPLNERDVARLLRKLGFREGEAFVTPDALSRGDVQLMDRDGSVIVDCYQADGRLRLFSVEPHGGDEAAWKEVEQQLRRFAGKHALAIREETS